MGRQSLFAKAATAIVAMKVFLLLALGASQINGQRSTPDGMGSGNGMGSGYGMGGGSGCGMGYGGYGMGSGMGGGYGMGSGMRSTPGENMRSTPGMGRGYGGMDMDMSDMEWPRRCRRSCVYQKRDSKDNRMYCMARSEYGESMCMREDYDGEKPINVSGCGSEDDFGYGMGGSGSGMDYGSTDAGMGSIEPMAEPAA